MSIKVVKVFGCFPASGKDDCPFLGGGEYYTCYHPDGPDIDDSEAPSDIPRDCPLRRKPILVKLAE